MHNRSVAQRADAGPLCASRSASIATILGGLVVVLGTALYGSQPAEADAPPRPGLREAASIEEIAVAKTEVADLYAGVQAGTVRSSELRAAEWRLSLLTGEAIPSPRSGGRERLQRDFAPFRQVTDYYCGPATVQSILWFLGVRDEAGTAAPARATGMTGRPDVDQPELATDSWLGTEAAEGTAWGEAVPDALNRWRGTRWYAAFGTPNANGTLHKEQAMRDIVYAIDHGYPVAANVLLSDATLIPDGFSEGSVYTHWETIVGYFDRDGTRYVKIGQVYGEGAGYDPLHEIAWDEYWPAIESWYGIVW